MRMDIATPVELVRFEQTDFGADRRQAYLTFLNETPSAIKAITGLLALYGAQGEALESRRIAFTRLSVKPWDRFTCHLALDDYPVFTSASLQLEEVLFHDETPWAFDPSRAHDYDPPLLPDGPERIALVAIAGEDAVCFPARDGSNWVCVCGRYNRWRWTACRRCHRQRDKTLAELSPEPVMRAYGLHQERARQLPPRVILDGTTRMRQRAGLEPADPPPKPAARPQRKAREKPVAPPAPPPARQADAQPVPGEGAAKPRAGVGYRIAALLVTLAVVGAIVWGANTLAQRIPSDLTSQLAGQLPAGSDYLTPIR